MKSTSNKKNVFWSTKNGLHIKYIINPFDLINFLEASGFHRFRLIDSYKLIHIKDSIAREVTPLDVNNYCLDYVKSFNIRALSNDFVRQGETHIVSRKTILGGLKPTELFPIKDEKDKSFVFYKNHIVEIVPNKNFRILEYSKNNSLLGFVWDKSILNRNFKENKEESVFEKFLKKVTNDMQHFKSVVSAIGYLLHRYKNPSINKAIIISDENTESQNQANGRTGKGLIISAIGKFITIAFQNGKNVDFSNNRFAYQNVDLSTDLIFLDDVKQNFSFEQLFSILTNDMTVEQKNKPIFTIPFASSPKLVLTTNYSIKGNSSSHKGRKFVIFLNNYFNDKHTPIQEFKSLFFDEWDTYEWQKFDTFMLGCLRSYLENGLEDYQSQELILKQLKKEITSEVFELLEIECNEINKFYKLNELGKDKNMKELQNLKSVELYADYKGYIIKKKTIGGYTFFGFVIE